MSTIVSMSRADHPLVRARVDPRRKRNAETILSKLGITPGQAVNMLYAQIELRRALPFPVAVENNGEILAPPEIVAETWEALDRTDYGYLKEK